MDSSEVERAMREVVAVRVGPHMADYISQQLQRPEAADGFFMMGGDARTGRPVRQRITPGHFTPKDQDP